MIRDSPNHPKPSETNAYNINNACKW
ncbi:hypothetical protein ACVNP1_00955 [Staphylococcus aureus]